METKLILNQSIINEDHNLTDALDKKFKILLNKAVIWIKKKLYDTLLEQRRIRNNITISDSDLLTQIQTNNWIFRWFCDITLTTNEELLKILNHRRFKSTWYQSIKQMFEILIPKDSTSVEKEYYEQALTNLWINSIVEWNEARGHLVSSLETHQWNKENHSIRMAQANQRVDDSLKAYNLIDTQI